MPCKFATLNFFNVDYKILYYVLEVNMCFHAERKRRQRI